MKKSIVANLKAVTWRRMAGIFLAIALAGSLVALESVKPVAARAASATPAAAPLDEESVGALLSLDRAMETLAAKVTPAIVNVAVTSRTKPGSPEIDGPDDAQRFFGPFFGRQFQMQPRVEHGIGSGVIVSPDGYIVTNYHVIEGATDIRVTTSDRKILNAKLVGSDPLTDVAVIKVNGSNLPSAPWGESKALHPGQTVLAFGNPFGFRFTVTRGIVSALNRPNPYSTDPRKPGGFIQTDAAINQGNSGGPLVDARGQVVGINTFLISPSGAFSGMGFAIPSQLARPIVETLIRDGKVTHGYMGLGIADVTPENAGFFHLNRAEGALVSQVEPGSPAASAGVKVGDVIVGIDERTVNDASQLQMEVSQRKPGSTIHLKVMREEKEINVPVTLEEMGSRDRDIHEARSLQNGKPRWGLGLSDLTPEMREQDQLPPEVRGALIQQIQPGSPADNAGLQPGDVILSINRQEVRDVAGVQKYLSAIPKGQDALVLVWSNGGSTFRVMHAPDGA